MNGWIKSRSIGIGQIMNKQENKRMEEKVWNEMILYLMNEWMQNGGME